MNESHVSVFEITEIGLRSRARHEDDSCAQPDRLVNSVMVRRSKMIEKTGKKAYVVLGRNFLVNGVGPSAVAFTREAAEVAQKDAEWIHDESGIIEVDVWE